LDHRFRAFEERFSPGQRRGVLLELQRHGPGASGELGRRVQGVRGRVRENKRERGVRDIFKKKRFAIENSRRKKRYLL